MRWHLIIASLIFDNNDDNDDGGGGFSVVVVLVVVHDNDNNGTIATSIQSLRSSKHLNIVLRMIVALSFFYSLIVNNAFFSCY